MNKISSIIMVLLTTFIGAALALTFVTGQADFFNSFSSDAKNNTRCNALAERAEAPGTQAAQEYQELNCASIYGRIDFADMGGDAGVTKMNGITIGQWPGEVFYDRNYTYNYEIDFEELDGQEYLSVYGGDEWNNGVFNYKPEYNYTIGFQVAFPTEDGDIENVKQWGGDTGNICSGEEAVCQLQNNFTYSEQGDLAKDLIPCQDITGDKKSFTQRIFVQVFENFGEPNQQKKAWITLMNQSVTLSDNQGTPCWSGGALPTFDNGKIYLRSLDYPANVRIDQKENISMTVDISNNPRNLDTLEMAIKYPTGSSSSAMLTGLGNVTVGEDCQNICELETEVNLQEAANPLACDATISVDQDTLQLYLIEDFEGTGSNSWLVDSAYAQNEDTATSQFQPRCWFSVGYGYY